MTSFPKYRTKHKPHREGEKVKGDTEKIFNKSLLMYVCSFDIHRFLVF